MPITQQIALALERQFGPFVHMSPQDKQIWIRFLTTTGQTFAPYAYDFRVGEGLQMPAGSTLMERNIALALTTKRIDAIAEKGDVTHIFEVKPRAGLSAVGQVLGYVKLYRDKMPNVPMVHGYIVTDGFQPDVKQVCDAAGVRYFETGD